MDVPPLNPQALPVSSSLQTMQLLLALQGIAATQAEFAAIARTLERLVPPVHAATRENAS